MTRYLRSAAAIAAVALFGGLVSQSAAQSVELLSQDDFIIAIDVDGVGSNSSYPDAESPFNASDLDVSTKYLNFGELDTGVIYELLGAPAIAQSLVLATANDAVERDPTAWQLFGSNDTTPSIDNGAGDQKDWTFIAGGGLDLPLDRDTFVPAINFTNDTAYSAYRLLFPTVRDEAAANSMQIAEAALYSGADGTGDVVSLNALPSAFQLPSFTSSFPGAEGPENVLDGNGPAGSQSDYPDAEGPTNLIDDTLNKYLNEGGPNSGFIVTPAGGPSTVMSFQLTTANDDDTRDPVSYQLFGTNDSIVSADNSFGLDETWTLISEDTLFLPAERDTIGDVVSFTNDTAYSSYKMLFPENFGSGLFQLAEAAFYSTSDGSGTDILAPESTIIAIDEDPVFGLDTKYLNFGEENSGLIITPASGNTVVDGLQITTANDAQERDPASWELYGTNDPITSVNNSDGAEENWVLIDSGTFSPEELPFDRLTEGAVAPVDNTTAYKSYRIVFPTVVDEAAANSMQIATLQLIGEAVGLAGDFNGDGMVDAADYTVYRDNVGETEDGSILFGNGNGGIVDIGDYNLWVANFGRSLAVAAGVPEPTAVLLALAALLPAARRR